MPEVERRLSEAIPDRYRIVREIGAGGMAHVFLAEDLKLGRRVAIKVLRPELGASVTGTRFHREVRIAAGLAHPNIVPVHDSGEADGLLYFVMRFQEGESLRALLDRDGALPVDRAVAIARDVAEGLAYAHGHGVIHRDIKPANILLTGEHAVIADFGVARGVESATMDGPPITVTDAAVGTPLYMSPEQASANPDIDGRSDIYSLGCVLFEMLTGEPLFQAKGMRSVLASHLYGDVPSVTKSRPEVPSPLDDAVRRCLAKSADARFTTANDLRLSLESVQAGLDGGRRVFGIRWGWLSRRTRRLAATAATVSFLVVSFVLARLLVWPDSSTLDPSSLVVLSFRGPLSQPGEEELLVDLAEELTHQLNQWDSVSAVPQISLSGIRFDRGIERPTLEYIDDGLEIAQDLGAGTMVALSANLRGDSVVVSVDLFNPETGRAVGQTIETRGGAENLIPVVAEVTQRILGLEGLHAEIEGLRSQSSIPEALIEYESGRRALERWRLAEAEDCLRKATDLDGGFAMAHHLLALTLYWQYKEGLLNSEAGEEVSRESTLAQRNSNGLSLRDSLHVQAFHSFQAGDYGAARGHYRTLLERDSADVFAWFLQGSVELQDPWLVEMPKGELVPRSDLNLARRSFQKTVNLSPGLQGAYGRIFEIAGEVTTAPGPQNASGFEVPRDEYIAPWAANRTPFQARAFNLVYGDSLVWVERAHLDTIPEAALARGAGRILDESLAELRRWAAYEPDEARPQRELARRTLSLRSQIRGPHPPSLADSLAREGFRYASRALELSADTLRADLVRLANLHLAHGEIEAARSVLDLALEWDGPELVGALPSPALNVLLYSGRPAQALALMAGEEPPSYYFPDPDTGELVGDGGANAQVRRLQILAATQVGGPPLEAAFQDLTSKWMAAGNRSEREMEVLMGAAAPSLAVALMLSPDRLESWRGVLGLRDPLWAALAMERESGQGLVQAALRAEEREVGDPIRSYLLGTVAHELGEDSLAVGLFSRLDSLVYGVEVRDMGWGLLALSYFHRGAAYQALGDTDRATHFYQRFTEAWSEPDMNAALSQEARRRLEQLSR